MWSSVRTDVQYIYVIGASGYYPSVTFRPGVRFVVAASIDPVVCFTFVPTHSLVCACRVLVVMRARHAEWPFSNADVNNIFRRLKRIRLNIIIGRQRFCHKFRKHTLRYPCQCTRCGCWVVPGCVPETGLAIDEYTVGPGSSISSDCWPGAGPAPVSGDFREIWQIMGFRGY